MKLLLDTCTFLWLNNERARIPPATLALCADTENQLFLSVVSAWEISVKYATGRLSLPEPADRYIPERRHLNGADSLALTEEDVLTVAKLPLLHGDPFDRLLICQAIAGGLTLLTPDEQIARYPVRVIW